MWNDGPLTVEKLRKLYDQSLDLDLNWQEVLLHVRPDSIQELERYVAFAGADGVFTDEELGNLTWFGEVLQIPKESFDPIFSRACYLKSICDINLGHLPIVRPSVHVSSDEICYLESASNYYRQNLRSTRVVQGRLLLTNKRIHFLSSTGGWTILWKNVMQTSYDANGVFIELAVKNGNGYYAIADPLRTCAIINTVTRLNKRQQISNLEQQASRHIPQHVKVAVWQRDQGKCVQCSATSYLEFDHIIPFDKGGSNSERNIQLLCRKCNQTKRNRI